MHCELCYHPVCNSAITRTADWMLHTNCHILQWNCWLHAYVMCSSRKRNSCAENEGHECTKIVTSHEQSEVNWKRYWGGKESTCNKEIHLRTWNVTIHMDSCLYCWCLHGELLVVLVQILLRQQCQHLVYQLTSCQCLPTWTYIYVSIFVYV